MRRLEWKWHTADAWGEEQTNSRTDVSLKWKWWHQPKIPQGNCDRISLVDNNFEFLFLVFFHFKREPNLIFGKFIVHISSLSVTHYMCLWINLLRLKDRCVAWTTERMCVAYSTVAVHCIAWTVICCHSHCTSHELFGLMFIFVKCVTHRIKCSNNVFVGFSR